MEKTFAGCCKIVKVFSLERFPLYGIYGGGLVCTWYIQQKIFSDDSAICTNERCILKQMPQSTVHFERPAQQATEPQAKQEARSVLCHVNVWW